MKNALSYNVGREELGTRVMTRYEMEGETKDVQENESGLTRADNTCATLVRAWHV